MEQKIMLIGGYITAIYCIFHLLGFVKSTLFQTKEQRLYAIIILFYAVVPSVVAVDLIYFGSYAQSSISDFGIHILLLHVAFYTFGTIEEFRSKAKAELAVVIHHIIFGTVILLLAIYPKISHYLSGLLVFQISGVFVYIKKILYGTAYYQVYKNRLSELDFFAFLSSRIVGQNLFMFVTIYLELMVAPEINLLFVTLLLPSFVLSTGLNLGWLKQILKRRANFKKAATKQVYSYANELF